MTTDTPPRKLYAREIDALCAERVLGWTNVGDVLVYPGETGPEVSCACYGNPPLMKPIDWDHLDKCGVPPGRARTYDDEPLVNGASVYSMSVVPRFTYEMTEAWYLVTKLRTYGENSDTFSAFIDALDHTEDCRDLVYRITPLDICRAALAACGDRVEVRDE